MANLPGGVGRGLGVASGAVRIDTSDLNRVEVESRRVGQQVNRNLGQINSGASLAQRSIGALTSAFRSLGPALGLTLGAAGVVQLVRVVDQLSVGAAQADRTRESFNRLAEGVGESGDAMLEALEEAANGAVSRSNLILAANRAMTLGVSTNTEDLVQLLELARVRGADMGLSLTQAFNDIVTGIGRVSPLILDNLGIVIDAEGAYQEYATSLGVASDQLTDTQRKQALLNQVLEQSRDALATSSNLTRDDASAFERRAAATENLRDALGRLTSPSIARGANALASALNNLADALDRQREQRTPAGQLEQEAEQLEFILDRLRTGLDRLEADRGTEFFDEAGLRRQLSLIQQTEDAIGRLRLQASGIRNAPVPQGFLAPSIVPRGDRFQVQPEEDATPVIDQNALRLEQLQFFDNVQRIERQANEQRLQEAQSFGRQRASIISGFNRSILREEQDFVREAAREIEDFTRDRARQFAQLDRQIADIRSEASRREIQIQEESQRREIQQRETHERRISELQEDFNRQRRRAERDHRDNLLDAASRLDARAILEEQRRFRNQTQDQEEQLQDRIEQERDNFDERLEEQREADERRLREQREADERRIDELRVNLAEQQRLEDEDRAIRIERQNVDREIQLQRQREDHELELQEQARAHGERIAQIGRQEAQQREELNRAFGDRLIELGLHNDAWLILQEDRQEQSLELFKGFWRDWNTELVRQAIELLAGREDVQIDPLARPPAFPQAFQSGGPVLRTGMALVHRGEFVMPRGQVQNMGDISIIVQGGPGGQDTAIAVRNELESLLRSFGGV